MNPNLVVNPYLSIMFGTEPEDRCVCVAPKPGVGLKMLHVSENDQPDLYQLFRDMTTVSLETADVTDGLSPQECDILIEHGVLIAEADAPKRILFSCLLNEIAAGSVTEDVSSLTVNPSLRFEPFSLENFRSWISDWNLSPHQPSAWVKNSTTGVECGYWLTPSEAELISGFVPGEKPKLPDDDDLVSRCLQAEILVTDSAAGARSHYWTDALSSAREKFANSKYAVLQSLFPPAQTAAIRRFYRDYVAQGFMPFGDAQVENRYRQYNEPFATFIHKMLTPLMSEIVGEPVKPSYCYAASYKDSAVLNPHTDRLACEFSISFQVDYEPEPPGHLSPWALYVEPFEWSGDLPETGAQLDWDKYSDEKTAGTAIHLANGDGLVYKGRELVHYRYALPAGHRSTSLFFHYVAADFSGSTD
jgi:hypothetical protein